MAEAETLSLDVLIAEDDPISCDMLRSHLEMLGCHVRIAKNGNQAIRAARSCAACVDLIVLDAHMPGPEPCELYERVREASPNVPILICSALSEWDSRLDFIVEHDLMLLMKPFELAELRRAIENVLGEHAEVAALC